MKAMLLQGKFLVISKLFVLTFLLNCTSSNKTPLDVSLHQIGICEYANIYNNLQDSFRLWVFLKARNVIPETSHSYILDSLICFNKDKTRFIGCSHIYNSFSNGTMDDIKYVYGEKINGHWYFLRGPSLTVPRSMVSGHDIHTPLSYYQLHQIALKEIYSGYLTQKGEINEMWFTSHFEDAGWGSFEDQGSQDWWLKGRRFTNKKEFFEFIHLEKVRSNWYGFKKDSVVSSSDKLK
jgi:hypothetical protein